MLKHYLQIISDYILDLSPLKLTETSFLKTQYDFFKLPNLRNATSYNKKTPESAYVYSR